MAQHLADMKAMEQRRCKASSSSKRKRKKRSKRKLPKSSSGVRLRRCGQGFRSRYSFSGAQCSRLLTTGPRCSTSWPVRKRRTVMCSSCARLVFLAILHLALCFLPCLRSKMPVIMAGMDHRTVWRFTGAVLGQGLLHARWCAMSGVMVQTVQKSVWRFHRCSSSSRTSTSFSLRRGSSPWSRLFS